MAVYTNAGGGGGIDPSELTAEPWAVLAPYTAGMKGMDEPGSGTMVNRGAVNQTLNAGQSYTIPAGYHNGGGTVTANGLAGQTAGTALAGDIYPGKTAWVNGVMLTGAMAVYSVVSFSIAVTGSSTVTATWVWPSRGPYSGVAINYKTNGYPVNPWDGTRAYTGTGTNHNLGAASAAAIGGLQPSTTYYFSAWVYCSTSNGDMFSGYLQAAGTTIPRGMQTFTSSGVFVVPAGVTSIDVFCVGGGSNGCQYNSNGTGWEYYGAGGGSGYTSTGKQIAVSPGQQFAVTVGSGAVNPYKSSTLAGGASSFGNLVYAGGGDAYVVNVNMHGSGTRGGKGGSGGAGAGGYRTGYTLQPNTPVGGTDGNSGQTSVFLHPTDPSQNITLGTGGPGQGRTTRAFMEPSNTLYASGGNGALSYHHAGADAAPNTGNGGEGGGSFNSSKAKNGNGGSGIVLVRWGY